MDLKIRVDGLEKVQDLLARLDRDGLRNATAKVTKAKRNAAGGKS